MLGHLRTRCKNMDVWKLGRRRITVEREARFHQVLQKRQVGMAVLLDNVAKEHNLAAVARSCDAVGVWDIHACVNPNMTKAKFKNVHGLCSAGVGKWMRVQYHYGEDIAACTVDTLCSQGYSVFVAHPSTTSVSYTEADFTSEKMCLVVGAEGPGVSQAVLDHPRIQHVSIPMHGFAGSLNVSVATAVVLFEAQRQRMARGMYDLPTLPVDGEEYAKTIDKWKNV